MLSLVKPTLDVGIVPADADAMKAFYADVLGLAAQAPMPVPGGTLVGHQHGTSVIKLYCTDKPVERAKGGMHHTIGYRILTLVLPDFAAVVERAKAAGRRMQEVSFGGHDIAFLTDPDGNLLELVGGADVTRPNVQVGMSVASHAATRSFYVDALGLPEEPDQTFEGRTRHAVTIGVSTIKWFEADEGAPVHTGPITERAGIRYVTAWVDDLDGAVAELQAKGVSFPVSTTELGGVARLAIAADPDGSWVELVEPRS